MYKRKGISLITLIITIVVVIILAAAVILSLGANNPINRARVANLVSTKDSIESGILTYTSKVKAKILGTKDTYQIITGENDSLDYRIIEMNGSELETCIVKKNGNDITLYKIDKKEFKNKIDKLPSTPNSKCEWYLDQDGKAFLVFDENGQAPSWMTNKEKKIDDETLLKFVVYKGGEIGEGVTSSSKVDSKKSKWYDEIAESDPDLFSYSDNFDGTKTIIGFNSEYKGTKPSEIKIPKTTKDGAEINKIADYAFYKNEDITSLVVQSNIKNIQNDAFRENKNLKRVAILDGVEEIYAHAFLDDINIEEVYLSADLKRIDGGSSNYTAFNGCTSITKVTLPNFVVSNYGAARAFPNSKSKIIDVTYSGTITGIGYACFEGFTALSNIQIPEEVTNIAGYSFRGCSSLEKIEIPSNVVEIGEYAFYDDVKLASVNFNKCKSLQKIYNDAFRNCKILESVILPEGVSTLGNNSFLDDVSLKEVSLPSTITSVGNSSYPAFNGCGNIEKVVIPNFVVSSFGASTLFPASISKIKTVTYNGTITGICNYCFDGFTVLDNIQIPDSVTRIGSYSFRNCKTISKITMPSNVEEISEYAFYYDSNLNLVDFSKCNKLTRINNDAFRNCSALTSVSIPEGVTTLGNNSFLDDISLKEVSLPSTITSVGNSLYPAFNGCGSIEKVVIPNFVVSEFGASTLFPASKNKIKTVTYSQTITGICNYCFDGFTVLDNIQIPDSVTNIGSYSFRNCSYLSKIAISANAEKIGEYAFYCDSNLKIVDFSKCKKLTTIYNDAFRNCKVLESVSIPEGVTTLGNNSFLDDTGIKEVTLPSTIVSLGNSSYPAFNQCTGITKITCKGNVPSGSPWGAINATIIN